ncbi:MAG: RNA recognition motif domain-containing protein [Planctomycetota bacterium]|jgi:RNA recognition motif-containing protein
MNIYVGNLSLQTNEDDLRQTFEAFGFGFVGMPDAAQGKGAIDELNGKDLNGQPMKVEEGRAKATYASAPSSGRDRRGGPGGLGRNGESGGGRGGFNRGGRGERR